LSRCSTVTGGGKGGGRGAYSPPSPGACITAYLRLVLRTANYLARWARGSVAFQAPIQRLELVRDVCHRVLERPHALPRNDPEETARARQAPARPSPPASPPPRWPRRAPTGSCTTSRMARSPLFCRDRGGKMHPGVSMTPWPISQPSVLVHFLADVNSSRRAPP
jgi:hypothetical protein